MRCERARKWISDGRDGALGADRKARLERHLGRCPACRAYENDLARIEEAAKASSDPGLAGDDWRAFSLRLEARLAAAAQSPSPAGPPALMRRRWAWAGAGALVLAVVGTYLAVLRPGRAPGPVVLSVDEAVAGVFHEIGNNADLEASFNRQILEAIQESVPVRPVEAFFRFNDDPFVWEGMSEEELRLIEAELSKEPNHGGLS
jgi:anti-sigma factor RsiW